LALASADKTVIIRDINVGSLKFTPRGHSNWVTSLTRSDTNLGLLLASGSSNATVQLWNVTDGELKYILNGQTSEVTSLASLGNSILASGNVPGNIFNFEKKIKKNL
jgi:WD40 repeat protein